MDVTFKQLILPLCQIIVLAVFLERWFFARRKNLPPSPRRFPIIGNFHQLGPYHHRSLQCLSKRYGPLMLLHLGRVPVLIASSAEAAREIMKNQDPIFSNRPKLSIPYRLEYGCKDIGFAPYGEYWRKVRSICVVHLLSLKRVQSFRGVREEETSLMVEKDMFEGGTEDTSTALEWTISELIRNPRAMEILQKEVRKVAGYKQEINEDDVEKMVYLKAVIKESLRLHPPVPLLAPRESTQDTKVLGYEIASGTHVWINVWAISQDTSFWENSAEFIPERFLDTKIDFKGHHFEFTPFGAGRRGCPGIAFALTIIELALAKLVHNFNFALPDGGIGEDLDMSEVYGISVRKKYPLLLVATPHVVNQSSQFEPNLVDQRN